MNENMVTARYVDVDSTGFVKAYGDDYAFGDIRSIDNIIPNTEDESYFIFHIVDRVEFDKPVERLVKVVPKNDGEFSISFRVSNDSTKILKKIQTEFTLGLIYRMGLSDEINKSVLEMLKEVREYA